MRVGSISRNPMLIFYFIILGILAWYSVTKSMLFEGSLFNILFAAIPLIPIIGIPLAFLMTRIEIFKDHIKYSNGVKTKAYSLNGIEKVYRRTVTEHFSGEGVRRFPYVAFEYENGFILSFPFAFISTSKTTASLLDRIERLNPGVVFDKDVTIIKRGKGHPMNKFFRSLTLGLGTVVYIFFIF